MTSSDPHHAAIVDQFTRQAALFAKAPAMHGEEALALLVEAAGPRPEDETLDVACGPGSVVAVFAERVRHAVGLDATEAMLREARDLAKTRGLENVEWHLGDVYRLPFADAAFDIVSCRFAFHHLETPGAALGEMIRVCRPGGRVVLCDGVASDDPGKAAAFNHMERHRDPSTVGFRPLSGLLRLYSEAGLPAPRATAFQVPSERDLLISISFPANDDRALLRRMIDDSVEGDKFGLGAHRDGETVRFAYPAVILVSEKPA
jgi:SAM-dependent methyltransferase